MILENLVTFIGALLKHVIGVLLLCWRRMLRAGLIAFAIGIVVTVLVEVVSTGEAIPSVLALIAALLLGLALGYGVALTVLVEELILGVIDLIRVIEGDVSAGAHITEVVAEREVGQVGQGLRRLIGLPVSKRPSARPGASLPPLIRTQPPGRPSGQSAHPPGSIAAASLIEAGAAVAVRAAAAAAVSAAARSAAHASSPAMPEPATPEPAEPPTPAAAAAPGEPVPADRLPRIGWTYEPEATRPLATPEPSPAPTAEPVAKVAEPVAEAAAPIAEAAAPVASEAPRAAPASGDLPSTLSELAGVALFAGAATPAAPESPALEAPYDDERLAAPASVATPEGPAEPAERVDDVEERPEVVSAEPVDLASEWDEAPGSVAQMVVDAPAAPVEVDAGQPTHGAAPAGRSDFSRRTLPLSDGDASPGEPRSGVTSGPRPSAPESGLWERLSNALVNRTGVPSGPFAPAPQQPPSGDGPATDGDAPQEPGSGGKA